MLSDSTSNWRDVWESTSFQLECLQTNPACVEEEKAGQCKRKNPEYCLTFDPDVISYDMTGKKISFTRSFLDLILTTFVLFK